jgi:hypothetical protein
MKLVVDMRFEFELDADMDFSMYESPSHMARCLAGDMALMVNDEDCEIIEATIQE